MITAMTYTFIESNIDLAPETQGVYVLYADSAEIIYFGSSENSIRARLRRHHSGAEGQCTKSASHFAWETTSRPLTREKELLDEFEAKNGRLPRCNERVG